MEEGKVLFEVYKLYTLHTIEALMLLTIIIELLYLLVKVITKDEGKPMLVMIMLSTISIREIMLMVENIKPINLDILLVEVFSIFLTFILINTKSYLLKEKDSKNE